MARLRQWESPVIRCGCFAGAIVFGAVLIQCLRFGVASASGQEKPASLNDGDLIHQTDRDVTRKSRGCQVCHVDMENMHGQSTVKLGCTDCHGGNADAQSLDEAHIHPRFASAWPTSANPVRS